MQLQNYQNYQNEQFIVGKGSIVTSNLCIPLHAIACLRIEGKKKMKLDIGLWLLIIGIFLMFIPSMRVFGAVFLCGGIVTCVCIFLVGYLQKYGLAIQLQSGATFTFWHSDLEFIKEIAEVIRKGFDDAAGITYIDMSKTKIVQKIKGDPSFLNFGTDNNFGDIITGDENSVEKNYYGKTDTSQTNMSVLSAKEWKELEHYFHIQAEELGTGHESYQACKKMEQYANKEDASGLSRFLNTVGKTILIPIIQKAAEYGVNELLRTLILLK